MIKKWIVVLTAVLLAAVTMFGVSRKSMYTNITADLSQCYVGVLAEDNAVSTASKMRTTLASSPIIIRATASEGLDPVFGMNQQLVRVEEVYKGEGLVPGDSIYVTSFRWYFMMPRAYGIEETIIETGCVNIMEVGTEYLLFLDGRIDTKNPNDTVPIYLLTGDFQYLLSPVFSYEEHENVVAQPKGSLWVVPYKDVAQNEFFAATDRGMEALVKLKHDLIERYPR